MTTNEKRLFFERYSSAVVYLETEDAEGKRGVGSAFHVGDGVFVTARHVVEHRKIITIATTERSTEPDPSVPGAHKITHFGGDGELSGGPLFHPDPKIDIAVLQVKEVDAAVLELGGHLDDWIGSEFVLSPVVLFGYPRVPHANGPVLVAVSGEVNAVVDLYSCPKARFIVSQLARGGFSGGPAISGYGFVLGVVTDSLVENDGGPESGFCSVISVEPILDCLHHHKIMPAAVRKLWNNHGLYSEDLP